MPVRHVFTSPKADDADTELVRPSDWNSVHALTLIENLTLAGNTAGVMAAISSGTVLFAGGNNVTLSQNGNSITISGGAAGGAQTGISGISAGGAIATSGTVEFANSNGVTFGLNNQTLTASYSQSTHTHATYVAALRAGTTLASSGTISFADSNGVGFGLDGQTLTASYTQSTHPHTAPVVSDAIQAVGSATGSGTNTSRFAADDHVHLGVFSAGVSTGGNTAGDTAVRPGRLVLAGGNNITLSMATAAGSLQTVSIVGPNTHAQQTGISGVAAAGGTVTSGTLSIADSNGLAFGINGQTLTGSYSQSTHSHEAHLSAGISTGGNTAGDTGFASLRLALAGGDNITLSGSTNGGSMTVTISGGAGGAAG
jgi:hypothetical protein